MRDAAGFDIYILEIDIPQMDGIAVAREIHEYSECASIIYETETKDRALEAFEVNAVQYLIKGYPAQALYACLTRVMRKRGYNRRRSIVMKTTDGMTRIYPRNILYVETSRNNYQMIYLCDGTSVEVRMTSLQIYNELSPMNSLLIKCGASLSINLYFVSKLAKGEIIFENGEKVLYPYRYYAGLKEQLQKGQ